jgi:hypothetical protein
MAETGLRYAERLVETQGIDPSYLDHPVFQAPQISLEGTVSACDTSSTVELDKWLDDCLLPIVSIERAIARQIGLTISPIHLNDRWDISGDTTRKVLRHPAYTTGLLANLAIRLIDPGALPGTPAQLSHKILPIEEACPTVPDSQFALRIDAIYNSQPVACALGIQLQHDPENSPDAAYLSGRVRYIRRGTDR